MNRVIYLLVFVVGLAVALWVGAGYLGSNLLALAVTAIIVAAYSFGGLELLRFRQATQTLDNALSGVESGELNVAPGNVNASTTPTSSAEAVEAAAPPAAGSAQLSLGPGPAANASTAHTFQAWLSQLDPTLRDTVRLRVEGERVGLPGPTLTPYLVGLLVLLGMLGTFLGMVATLRGTGLALEHATDLQAIRASLAAPVKGLGFAFGTSVAGVAASAMLGLMAALARRDRIRAGRRLDAAVAGALRVFSKTHQRDESFKLMQQHAQALPVVAERLQTMIEALDNRSLESVEQLQQRTSKLDERLQQNAELLHQRLEERAAAQDARLAAGQEALNAKLTELYTGLTASVQKSLTETLAETGTLVGAAIQPVVESTLAGLARESAALQSAVQQSVQQQLASLSGQFEQSTTKVAGIWTDALAEHQRVSEAQLQAQKDLGESLIKEHQLAGQSLVEQHKSAGEALIQAQQRAGESWASDLRSSLDSVSETFAQRSSAMVDSVAERLDAVSTTLSAGWQDTLAVNQSINEKLAVDNQQALSEAVAALQQHSASLVSQLAQSHTELKTALAQQDEARLAQWSNSLNTTVASLREEWGELTSQTKQHAAGTIAGIQQLLNTAAEAPKMAADVIAQMRDKLSDSLERDNAMLEERSRMLETLATLLDAVNHASTQQRTAVDELLSSSSNLLDRIGTQVTEKVEAEANKLGYMASQVTGSAIEISGLGDTFGKAVKSFGESNAVLIEHLQRIEQALDKTLVRSDEQLAYYVAQAREVVDLSMLSQKQILEELQHVGGGRPNLSAPHSNTKSHSQLKKDRVPAVPASSQGDSERVDDKRLAGDSAPQGEAGKA